MEDSDNDCNKDNVNLKEVIGHLQRRLREYENLIELLQENRKFLKDNCTDLQEQIVLKDNYVKCAAKWRDEANEIFVESLMESYNEIYTN